MSQVTDPILLDSTGQDMVTQLAAISARLAAGLPGPYAGNPAMDGAASPGSSTLWARGDHVHPKATSKQDVVTFDTTPISGSSNPVTSGGVKAALDKEVIVVNIPAFSSLPQTVSNAAITANHVLQRAELGTPSAQTGDWTVTTANGSLTISGNISGSTTLKIVLGLAGTTI